MKRPRLPMFRAGNEVIVWYGHRSHLAKVVMASVAHRSLFIDLPNGSKLTVLGVQRKKRRRRR